VCVRACVRAGGRAGISLSLRACPFPRPLSLSPAVSDTPCLCGGGRPATVSRQCRYLRSRRALTPTGTLVWCTTTPVPPSYTRRNNTDVVAVNALAAKLFGPGSKYPEVPVHDLYSEVVRRCNNKVHAAVSKGYAIVSPPPGS